MKSPILLFMIFAISFAWATPLSKKSIYNLNIKLTKSDNTQFNLSDLRGKPVVASMVFLSCPNACPMLVKDIKKIEERLKPELKDKVTFLIVSFDPETDTPEAMRAYAKKRGIEKSNWWLCSASEQDVRILAAVLGITYKKIAKANYSHSTNVVALDKEGVIKAHVENLGADPAPIVDFLNTY